MLLKDQNAPLNKGKGEKKGRGGERVEENGKAGWKDR